MRTRAALALLAAGMAGGCGSRSSGTVQAEAPAKAATPAHAAGAEKTITIEPEAQRLGGIVVSRVESRSIPVTVSASGRLTWNEDRTVHVGAIAEGRVAKVLVSLGDTVRAGQVLARIHSHDVHEMRAEYAKAVQELSRRRSAQQSAERLRDRASRLYELKAGSLEALEVAQAELRDAQAAVTQGSTDVQRARTHLEEFLGIPAEDSGHEEGKHDEDADFIPVRASAAGLVVARQATPGAVVQMAAELFTIADVSSLWMIANVAESDLAKLRVGMPVNVRVQAFPDQVFVGRLQRLGEQLDASTRTLQTRVLVPNRGGRLKPEMYASAEMEEGQTRPALFIPAEAVQDVNGQSVVFVRRSQQEFIPRAVQAGREQGGELVVLAGLRAGEQIVTKGSFVVKSQLLKNTLSEE